MGRSLASWDESNLLQFAVTEVCSGSGSRADVCYWWQAAVSQDCWGAKMSLSWQGEDCWSAPGLLGCTPLCVGQLGDLIPSRYLVTLTLALSLGTPGGYCHGLWPLHPTVLRHFSTASFTCPSQAAAVAVAGGQGDKSVLTSRECFVTLSLGEALKAG